MDPTSGKLGSEWGDVALSFSSRTLETQLPDHHPTASHTALPWLVGLSPHVCEGSSWLKCFCLSSQQVLTHE